MMLVSSVYPKASSICSKLPINALLAANCNNASRASSATCAITNVYGGSRTCSAHDNFGLAVLTRDLCMYFRKLESLPAGEMSSVGELKITRTTRREI